MYCVLRIALRNGRRTTQYATRSTSALREHRVKRYPVVLALLALLFSTLACGIGGPISGRNNDIRRAALAYELATHGPVDEVLVALDFTEVRDNLGFKGGNTVWLNWAAEGEYFRQRDATKSYLFLHDLSRDDGGASILTDRGNSGGVQHRKLYLREEGDVWAVVSDEPTADPASP